MNEALHTKVLIFLSRFTANNTKLEVVDTFTSDCSYWIALALKVRFIEEETHIMYDPAANHFGCLVGDFIYDITGNVTGKYRWKHWSTYKTQDKLEASKIERDNIFF